MARHTTISNTVVGWVLLAAAAQAQVVSPFATYEAAERYMAIGALREAEPEYLKLIALPQFDKRHEAMRRLGEIYLLQNRVDDLDLLTGQAVKEYPNSEYAHAGRAAACALIAQRSTKWTHQLKQATAAIDEASTALKINPANALARFTRGLVYFNLPNWMGRTESAVEDLQAVLRTLDDPYRTRFLYETYYYLALALRKLRKNDEALAVLREGMLLFPLGEPLKELYAKYGGKPE